MELTKDDYDILIALLEKEMDRLRLPAWYNEYQEFKRLRDTLIFIRWDLEEEHDENRREAESETH